MHASDHWTTDPGRIVQIAYAVDDVRAAALRFHTVTGAGPFFVRDHIPIDRAVHGSAPAVFDHSSACGQWGELMVEFVTHHRLEPAGLDRAMRRSRPGFHHVAWFVEDLDRELDRLAAASAEPVLVADTGAVRFAFVDPGEPVGHLVECYEPNDYLQAFYRAVRSAAVGWDGARPVRPRAELEV